MSWPPSPAWLSPYFFNNQDCETLLTSTTACPLVHLKPSATGTRLRTHSQRTRNPGGRNGGTPKARRAGPDGSPSTGPRPGGKVSAPAAASHGFCRFRSGKTFVVKPSLCPVCRYLHQPHQHNQSMFIVTIISVCQGESLGRS